MIEVPQCKSKSKLEKMEKPKNSKVPPLKPKYIFEETFDGPFIVHVRRYIDLKNVAIKPSIHKLSLAKILSTFLELELLEMARISKDTLKIKFPMREGANQLLKERVLWFKGYTAFVPNYLIKQTGVLRNIPLDITEEDIKIELELQNYEVLDVYRMKKRVQNQIMDSTSMKVTLQSHKLPKSVWLYNICCDLHPYVAPVIQCNNCYRFGHIAKNCRGPVKKCRKCGKASHSQNDSCKLKSPSCLHCKGKHVANDPNCPERHRQAEIKKIMHTHNVSFKEAERQQLRKKDDKVIQSRIKIKFRPEKKIEVQKHFIPQENLFNVEQGAKKVVTNQQIEFGQEKSQICGKNEGEAIEKEQILRGFTKVFKALDEYDDDYADEDNDALDKALAINLFEYTHEEEI